MALGARLLLGGTVPKGSGNYYPPTILIDTRPGMPIFDEETFGPAAAIAVADSEEQLVELANATPFGLSVSIWTGSTPRGVSVAKRIKTGAAFINAATASDARLPFGGVKRSGYGRELAAAGVRKFTNTRTYWATSP